VRTVPAGLLVDGAALLFPAESEVV